MEENTKLNLHKKICDELHNTYIKKNNDYGDSFGETFRDLGPISAITRISDKFNRIKNIVKNKEKDIMVSEESISDTLLDMANYCIMTAMEYEIKKKK